VAALFPEWRDGEGRGRRYRGVTLSPPERRPCSLGARRVRTEPGGMQPQGTTSTQRVDPVELTVPARASQSSQCNLKAFSHCATNGGTRFPWTWSLGSRSIHRARVTSDLVSPLRVCASPYAASSLLLKERSQIRLPRRNALAASRLQSSPARTQAGARYDIDLMPSPFVSSHARTDRRRCRCLIRRDREEDHESLSDSAPRLCCRGISLRDSQFLDDPVLTPDLCARDSPVRRASCSVP
jgi:hypothetical protein